MTGTLQRGSVNGKRRRRLQGSVLIPQTAEIYRRLQVCRHTHTNTRTRTRQDTPDASWAVAAPRVAPPPGRSPGARIHDPDGGARGPPSLAPGFPPPGSPERPERSRSRGQRTHRPPLPRGREARSPMESGRDMFAGPLLSQGLDAW